jgi:hypothetical protein
MEENPNVVPVYTESRPSRRLEHKQIATAGSRTLNPRINRVSLVA